MNTKHSPGQWESDDYGTPEQLYGIRTQFVILSQYGPVAYVYTEADARLIAATPALLKIAMEALALHPEWDEARAAIAAATGEQA